MPEQLITRWETLTLRKLVVADAGAYATAAARLVSSPDWHNDFAVYDRLAASCPDLNTVEQDIQNPMSIAEQRFGIWQEDRQERTFVGSASLMARAAGDEVSCWIDPRYRNQGYGAVALRGLRDHVLGQGRTPFGRVHATHGFAYTTAKGAGFVCAPGISQRNDRFLLFMANTEDVLPVAGVSWTRAFLALR